MKWLLAEKKDDMDNQLAMGIEVEREHMPTVEKIKASIQDGKITMSDDEIFESIAQDHIKESKIYYSELAKLEKKLKSSDQEEEIK